MHWFYYIRDSPIFEKAAIALRVKYSNIFRDVFVHLVFYISIQSFMTCRRSVKEKIFSFISYCVLYFNHSPITCTQIYRSPITCSPIPCSMIARSETFTPQYPFPLITLSPINHLLPPNRYLVFFCPTFSLIS